MGGTRKDGQIEAKPSDDGKGYTVEIKGTFFITLKKWTQYSTATDAQKKS